MALVSEHRGSEAIDLQDKHEVSKDFGPDVAVLLARKVGSRMTPRLDGRASSDCWHSVREMTNSPIPKESPYTKLRHVATTEKM